MKLKLKESTKRSSIFGKEKKKLQLFPLCKKEKERNENVDAFLQQQPKYHLLSLTAGGGFFKKAPLVTLRIITLCNFLVDIHGEAC